MNTVSLGKVFNKSECYCMLTKTTEMFTLKGLNQKTGALLLAGLMSPITSCQIINQFDTISL